MTPVRYGPRSAFARGLTIIELMLCVGLVGVLALVAWPSYRSYLEKGRIRTASQEIVTMSTAINLAWTDRRDYPDTLAEVRLDDRKDPWGRPYLYYNVDGNGNGKGGARKDKALNPINTDFDLYSMGPDGKSKGQVTQKDSVDDVIRANNGGFVGVAADF